MIKIIDFKIDIDAGTVKSNISELASKIDVYQNYVSKLKCFNDLVLVNSYIHTSKNVRKVIYPMNSF